MDRKRIASVAGEQTSGIGGGVDIKRTRNKILVHPRAHRKKRGNGLRHVGFFIIRALDEIAMQGGVT